MLGETPDYDKLKVSSGGVDFAALRDKYTAQGASSGAASAGLGNSGLGTGGAADIPMDIKQAEMLQRQQEAKIAHAALDKYRTCPECHGTGIRKYVYNFMSMQTNCELCEGDGLLPVAKETAETSASEDADADADADADPETEAEADISNVGEAASGMNTVD